MLLESDSKAIIFKHQRAKEQERVSRFIIITEAITKEKNEKHDVLSRSGTNIWMNIFFPPAECERHKNPSFLAHLITMRQRLL
jgi:hypothetical protein